MSGNAKVITRMQAGFRKTVMLIIAFLALHCTQEHAGTGPWQATGIKIGEVSDSEAIIWTRLTKDSVAANFGAPAPDVLYQDDSTGTWHDVPWFKKKYREDRPDRKVKVIFPTGYTVDNIDGAVPGALGESRVRYTEAGLDRWKETPWQRVDSTGDYTAQFQLKNLKPGTRYSIITEAKAPGGEAVTSVLATTLRTAPSASEVEDILFAVSTCQEYGDQDMQGGFRIYPAIQKMDPDFYVNAGDILYYDYGAKTLPLAKWKWQQMFALPTLYDFHNRVPAYFIKDDHDTWMNDSYPGKKTRFMGDFTFEQGLQLFRSEVPMGAKTYRTYRWGKDLQIWLMEGRDFRSPNDMPDGPDKTIWGKEQMDWFKKTMEESDATFKVVINPTPVVGPDRPQKKDNHANAGFRYEGNLIKDFLAQHRNAFVVCGDRHWQYASKDRRTGLREFSCGAASNEHAGGWNPADVLPEHLYLNVTGGFLAVSVTRKNEIPQITFTHMSVDGTPLHAETFDSTTLTR